MISIILSGALGHMGREMAALVESDPTLEIAAGVDAAYRGDIGENYGFPMFPAMHDVDESADVVVDFSVASATDALLDYCVEKKLPLVLCTTGLSAEQLDKVRACAQVIPILRSANMSLGISVMLDLVRQASAALYPEGYDIEIIEKHHRRKLDAPSGTAIMLAHAAQAGTGDDVVVVYDRTGRREERPRAEIGVSAVRGGTIVGEHTVILAGPEEVIELKHSAFSRSIFAKGAIAAARFLAGRRPGLYGMDDVIAQKN